MKAVFIRSNNNNTIAVYLIYDFLSKVINNCIHNNINNCINNNNNNGAERDFYKYFKPLIIIIIIIIMLNVLFINTSKH